MGRVVEAYALKRNSREIALLQLCQKAERFLGIIMDSPGISNMFEILIKLRFCVNRRGHWRNKSRRCSKESSGREVFGRDWRNLELLTAIGLLVEVRTTVYRLEDRPTSISAATRGEVGGKEELRPYPTSTQLSILMSYVTFQAPERPSTLFLNI